MAKISRADYETVVVPCDHCGKNCIFNRREDFVHLGPHAGENVGCCHCGREFHMVGDTISPPYELFIFSARESFGQKRYMLAAASLTQAWELFFTIFFRGQYLYRPFFLSGGSDIEKLNAPECKLEKALGEKTFHPLRNLLVRAVIKHEFPKTLDEADKAIAWSKDQDGNDPPKEFIDAVSDCDTKQALKALHDLKIDCLRNKVVHPRGYRPSRAEVEHCLEQEMATLYLAQRVLRVSTFDELQASRGQDF